MEFWITMLISAAGGFFISRAVLRFLVPGAGWIRRVTPYILFAFTLANKSWIGDENPLILFPFFIVAFLLCYGRPWYARLIAGGIFFSLLEPLCMMIDTANFKNISKWEYELVPLAIKLLAGVLFWVLSSRIVPEKGAPSLSGRLWGLLGGLSLAPLFSTLSFTIWNANWSAQNFDHGVYTEIVRRIAYTILPFTMLSALALLIAVVVLSRHEALEQRQKLAEIQEVYYQGLQREQTGVRTLRHDLHNHIAVAQGLLERGDITGVRQYLAQLSQSSALIGGKRYCENSIANAVLSSKLALMEQKEIRSDIQVSLPEHLDFPDVELCALLGNALDNAVEAAEKAEDKRISLHARADKGMLMLQLKNTLARAPKQANGRFITGKKDAASHGLGFAGMQEIARRHGGVCEAAYTQAEFCLIVSIPLPV